MFTTGVRSAVPLRSLLFFGILVLAPALARADDFSFSGDSGCTDPSIGPTLEFSFMTNSHGGECLAFGNHSGVSFHSLTFTTTFPTTGLTDPLLCDGGAFFANCGFSVDGGPLLPNGSANPGRGSMMTVEFFGGPGIPDAGTQTDNFSINLNNPGFCDRSPCPQPTSGANGTGDWVASTTVTGAANVPEPAMLPLLLVGLGTLLARSRMLGNRNG